MLNQQYTLTKLRTEIEKRKEKVSQKYKKFKYLAYNYKNKKKEIKKKLISKNKFEVLVSRVMKCDIKKEVTIKRQKTIEERKCFRCRGVKYYK